MITGAPRRNAKGGFIVHIGGMPLDPSGSQALVNHSPDGFSWGHKGSGAAQLALAVLLHFTDREFALAHYQEFKHGVIAGLPPTFSIRERTVKNWIKNHSKESNIIVEE